MKITISVILPRKYYIYYKQLSTRLDTYTYSVLYMKKATPKRINLPNDKSFVSRYERVPKDRLLTSFMIKRRYKERHTPKNKRRPQGGRGLFSFIKRLRKIQPLKLSGEPLLI